MAVKWTKNQQRIVDFSGGNLLVAAGAGSGKTAVLTAHIVQKITNQDEPVDLDQLLVVTFTNAAAAEMKERVRKNLEQRLADAPEDDNLIRQIGLIPSADISTIHSFCLKLIREQFFRLDIDPGFRLGDPGELALMRADILEELFEEQYEKQEQSFLDFRDMYGRGMNDGSVTELLIKLYEYAQSYPYPDQWLEKSIEDDSGWTRELCSALRQQTMELSEQLLEALEQAVTNHFPGKLINVLQEDINGLTLLNRNVELLAYCEALSKVTFGRKPPLNKQEKQDALGITDIIDSVFAVRDSVKASVRKLQETYSGCTQERLEYERRETAAMQQEMVRLIRLFSERFAERKKTLGICDFSDLEHMALRILYEDGKPSETADTYAGGYNEILIDEYQDCNLVQEAILYAVSSERFGRENRFMVGDVKQSIYGFRQARPELFLEKYQSYSGERDARLQKIELSANFRSRSGVLYGINMLFHQIMTERLGGISYDDKAALNPGAVFPERGKVPDMQLMLLDLGDADEEEGEDNDAAERMDASGYNNREHEARMVSGRILELVNPESPFMVYDNALGEMRAARFKDIVILMRSLSAVQESYVRVLKEMGIPVYVENESGYFTALEVSNVLDYLRILDNPMQDIPLAAVMRSAFGGFSAQELADIRLTGVGKGCASTFYACCMAAREESEKLDRFFFGLEQYRRLAQFVPIHELLLRILEETGYRYYVSALPQGKKRMMNLDMLVAKARSYEETSYRGLFHFIRYIDRLRTYDMDVDVPGGSADEVDAVRLMTIHKSKGLEFPIVFLSNMNGHFNKMDLNASVLLDEHYGIAADIKNARYRYRMKTLKKAAMRQKQLSGLLEEEMRVLYVAMTRAKELLIMTGADKELNKSLDKWSEAAPKGTGPLPLRVLSAADSYLDWIVPSVFAAEKEQKGFERPTLLSSSPVMLETDRYVLLMERFSKNSLSCMPRVQEVQEMQEYAALPEQLLGVLTWNYPDEALTRMHAAMSVSELKRAAYEEAEAAALITAETFSVKEDAAETEYADRQAEMNTRGQKETHQHDERAKKYAGSRSADRGTAYHRVLELFDFAGYPLEKSTSEKKQFVFEEVRRMMGAGQISKEDAGMVYVLDIAAFFETPLAKRMCMAARKGALHAEQPFLLGVPAKELSQETEAEQQWVLVRGIIDSYFEEDGGLVLVDYKTDHVSGDGGEAQLLARYRSQLLYYKRALEAALKKPVRQAYLYSFALGKEIEAEIF